MTVTVELRVLHLLCARLCHDLVGPIGAISNGIELVQEFGADMEKDAFDLIAGSAKRVASELQFFRVAYGLAAGMATTVADARNLAAPYVEGGRVKLDWPAQPDDKTTVIGDNPVKLALNMTLLGVEALARGGELKVAIALTPSPQITVAAVGDGVRLEEETRKAMDGTASIDELTPRSVQGYFTARLAESVGGALQCETDGAKTLRLTSAFRSGA
jgi:histidine phosphotransferase ChpT